MTHGFDALEFASIQSKNNKGQLDSEKIARLGRAISSQSELLLDSYLAYTVPMDNSLNTPTYRTLREFGVMLESDGQTKLSSLFRKILDTIAQKIHRQHIIPDIEEWKRELKKLSELVNHGETEPDLQSETDGYLAQIFQMCDELAESLTNEMNNIEYTIYAELSGTYDLHSKRLILKALIDKMTAQIEKLSSLSRDELYLCHDDNPRIHQILQLTLLPTIDKALHSFQGYLQKTVTLLDRMNARLSQNKTHTWRVHTALKNGTFEPSLVHLSYEDLMAHGLAYGGLGFATNQTVDVSDSPTDKALLHAIIDALPQKQPPKTPAHQHYDKAVEVVHHHKDERLSYLQKCAYDFLKSNNHKPIDDNVSAKGFWQEMN